MKGQSIMSDWRLHTPTGVNDILPDECENKKEIENTISYVFSSMGYRQVETPSFEFYDVYQGQGGQISQENMFKFFDDKGRIMVLRPDITTSIARICATKTASDSFPQRYSYTGSVFRAEQTQGARQREFTQSGIELVGSYSPAADAEVITAAIEAILAVGIEEFQVEIGQVAFFNGLVTQAGLDAGDTEKLRARIDAKDKWGIMDLTKKLDLDDKVKDVMIHLPYLFGGEEVFDKADVPGLNPISAKALENLRAVYGLLVDYGYEKYISIDLGMLQSIDYYTGIIFKCYTHGVGFPICAGGRYDNLVGNFGKETGAVGLAIGVNRIMSALSREKKASTNEGPAPSVIYADKGAERDAYRLAHDLRMNGCIIEMSIDGGTAEMAEKRAEDEKKSCFLHVSVDGRLLIIDFLNNEFNETTVDEFLGEDGEEE